MNEDPQVRMRIHLWLETDRGLYFGLGRARLLEKIEKYGSLKKAAQDMEMSYRAAWGKIKKTEEVIGQPLITKIGGNRKGYRLSEFGRELMEKFLRWTDDVERYALSKAASDLSLGLKSLKGEVLKED